MTDSSSSLKSESVSDRSSPPSSSLLLLEPARLTYDVNLHVANTPQPCTNLQVYVNFSASCKKVKLSFRNK